MMKLCAASSSHGPTFPWCDASIAYPIRAIMLLLLLLLFCISELDRETVNHRVIIWLYFDGYIMMAIWFSDLCYPLNGYPPPFPHL